MKHFDVTGMSCAACQARVEKAVSKVEGVTQCSVSLLTNSMSVEGTATEKAIIDAVVASGYGASVKGSGKKAEGVVEVDRTSALVKRLVSSSVFLLLLMYISMGHMMWNFPVPAFFENNHIALGIVQMLLCSIILVINQAFFISGFKALIKRAPNMDSLVALGSGVSFLWSFYVLLTMTVSHTGSHDLYFESSAMIVTLITIGKMLEERSKGKTTSALKALMDLSPKTATVIRGAQEMVVPVSEVRKKDIFIVRPGSSVPVDGIVIEGSSAVDESMLTGESIPVDKVEGSEVSGGTMNKSGFLKCQATRVGEDTTISQIIKMVSESSATKAPIAKIADKVSGIFVPVVISIAVITTFVWLILGKGMAFSLARGISVLVISCPCALGLATPVAIMVGSGVGARNGILFKTSAAMEETGRVSVVALDKTGTVTTGKACVTDFVALSGASDEVLKLSFALEKKSEHPLARAICAYAEKEGAALVDSEDFVSFPGGGVSALCLGSYVEAGSLAFMKKRCDVPYGVCEKASEFANSGKTPVLVSKDRSVVGLFAIADTIKEDSEQAIRELKDMGIRVVMVTGDNEKTARAIASQAGIDEVVSQVLPSGKAKVIEDLKKCGKVAMVGDGVNDALSLTSADVGFAIGSGTDVALDAADVVLMKSSLLDVPASIRLGRATLRNIRQNLFWAFFYNSIGIPLAAGCFVALGLTLNPMFGAAAMSLSSFCVVSNALRLNLHKVYVGKKSALVEEKAVKEDLPVNRTMIIEGMMCPHCEAHVKEALEALEGVQSAQASFKEGTALVTLSKDVDPEVLTKAVVDAGYTVISVN